MKGINANIIAILGAILALLSISGFNFNIPKFYTSLTMEGKILFWGIFNFIVIIFVLIVLLNKIDKNIEKSKPKSK